ncbi:gag protease polyprotein [Cucumis melo var. makuwa]|uniref:Gag protease polyprotein n=1 Tax=Cucumis melo var. makuwa TaxID=1194695 RepID=A0A5D3CJ43_CUCMM|nr:gag protease polyprotein [Cucumis melo var. makuwa]
MRSKESNVESSRPHVNGNVEEQLLDRLAQRLASGIRSTQADLEKKNRIERLKALEDRKVELTVFLLQNRAEDWWRMAESRREATGDINWDDFEKAFFDKFYLRSFRDPT